MTIYQVLNSALSHIILLGESLKPAEWSRTRSRYLKRRVKSDVTLFKLGRRACFVQSDDPPQLFRSRFYPFSTFVSVLFRSVLGFIVLLQSCLRRFMLGQSCALVMSLAPRASSRFL